MRLKLQTYSPIHIGNGEALASMDYVILGQNYYRVSLDMFILFLESLTSSEEGNYGLITTFSEWLLDQADALTGRGGNNMRGDWNQKRTQLNQATNYLTFCDTQNISKDFKRFLADQSQKGNIRKYRINSPLLEKKLQVRGQLVDGNQKIYIPGTSIKGAIRTALLYKALITYGEDYQEDLVKQVERDLSNRRRSARQMAKRIGAGIEHAMSYGGTRKKLEHQPRYDDVQQDVFKFLRVSDAILESSSTDPIEVVKTDLYLVTNVSRNSSQKVFRATRQPQSPYVEAIRRGVSFEFQLEIALEEIWSTYQALQKYAPLNSKRKVWIGLEKKILQIYGIDISSVTKDNLKDVKQKAEKYLLSAIAEFGHHQARFEKNWLSNHFLKEPFENITYGKEAFDDAFNPVFDYPTSGPRSLLRVGFGGGFANKTSLLYFLKTSGWRPTLKRVMEATEIGKRPGARGTYTANLEKFPKSRTLISYRQGVAPLGWAEIGLANTWEEDTQKINALVVNQKQEKATPKDIEAEYLAKSPKQGDIIDAIYLRKGMGKKKVFQLFLEESNTQEGEVNYFSDLVEGTVYRVKINALGKDKRVISFRFVGQKK